MIRVVLPVHLRTLAHVGSEVSIEVMGDATPRAILDALEARYPVLRGTIRDHVTLQRRPLVRFFACEEDLRTNRSMRRCRPKWPPALNRFSSSERWRAGKAKFEVRTSKFELPASGYVSLRIMAGSSRAARRAGIKQASVATRSSPADTAISATGSVALTLNRSERSNLALSRAAASPAITPTSTSCSP